MRIRSRWINGPIVKNAEVKAWQKPAADRDWTDWPEAHFFTQTISPTRHQYSEDESVSGWRSRIANGEIICNNFLMRTTINTPPQPESLSHYTIVNSGDGDRGAKFIGEYVPFGSTSQPSYLDDPAGREAARQLCYDLAVTQARAGLSESDALALATLGESRETVGFFNSTLERVVRIASRARRTRRRVRNPRQYSFTQLEDDYMEARYALRPLVYDVQSYFKARTRERGTVRRTTRGSHTERLSGEDKMRDVLLFYETLCDVERYYTYYVSSKAGVLSDVSIDAMHAYGITRLNESALELMPLSFIVDWFANVGDFIAASSPHYGVRELTSWCTTMEFHKVALKPVNIRSIAPAWFNVANSSNMSTHEISLETQTLTRVRCPQLPSFPRMRLNLDVGRITDLAIILRRLAHF